MRKFLDTKAGATFFEELPNLTINPRKLSDALCRVDGRRQGQCQPVKT